MAEREHIVVAILEAAGRELIGRVRFQKAAYLLERLGFGGGLEFEYHHYGPYSRDLENGIIDARAFGLIGEEFAHRQSDGAMYSRFKLSLGAEHNVLSYGTLGEERARELLRLFANTNVTVLELAATIVWLGEEEGVSDWKSEIIKRKGKKVANGRLEKAIELLEELNLMPSRLRQHEESLAHL